MALPTKIIIEFVNIGSSLKVTAVCEHTGREVSMVGDPKATRAELERLAANKLRYVMRKEAEERASGRRGLTV